MKETIKRIGSLISKNVFISGAMSGHDHFNLHTFIDAHLVAKYCGAEEVYNPALNWLVEPHSVSNFRAYEDYLAECVSELSRRTEDRGEPFYGVLLRLHGWEQSEGAKLETHIAERLGISIINLEP